MPKGVKKTEERLTDEVRLTLATELTETACSVLQQRPQPKQRAHLTVTFYKLLPSMEDWVLIPVLAEEANAHETPRRKRADRAAKEARERVLAEGGSE